MFYIELHHIHTHGSFVSYKTAVLYTLEFWRHHISTLKRVAVVNIADIKVPVVKATSFVTIISDIIIIIIKWRISFNR